MIASELRGPTLRITQSAAKASNPIFRAAKGTWETSKCWATTVQVSMDTLSSSCDLAGDSIFLRCGKHPLFVYVADSVCTAFLYLQKQETCRIQQCLMKSPIPATPWSAYVGPDRHLPATPSSICSSSSTSPGLRDAGRVVTTATVDAMLDPSCGSNNAKMFGSSFGDICGSLFPSRPAVGRATRCDVQQAALLTSIVEGSLQMASTPGLLSVSAGGPHGACSLLPTPSVRALGARPAAALSRVSSSSQSMQEWLAQIAP